MATLPKSLHPTAQEFYLFPSPTGSYVWWWITAPSTGSQWWTSTSFQELMRCLTWLEMQVTSPNQTFIQDFIRFGYFSEHVERTAFRTKYGTFAYQVMSFGLCNAPGTFQKTMDYILQNIRQFAGVYTNDILIYTKTLEDHLQALRKVYDKLRQRVSFPDQTNAPGHNQKSNTVDLSLVVTH